MELMIVHILLLILGLVILYFGAEYLVAGASKIALSFGISPMIIGLTIVALATSAPEFVVSLLAAVRGSPDLAIGNVVGSNVANIALIVGASAILLPMAVERDVLRRDYPIMVVALFVAIGLAWSGSKIDRVDGLILLGILAFFLAACLRVALQQNRHFRATGQMRALDPADRKLGLQITKVVGGIIALVVGANLMVDNAVAIARHYEISELVIGATIVALGTSLPELATAIVAALRKEPDISLGNILGSNIFNTCFILGGVSMIQPIEVSEQALRLDMPVMGAIGLLLFPIMRLSYKVTRADGVLLLLAYAGYIVASVMGSGS
ncbi:MAG: cation:H+ antiporter [Bradymonadia bacterium]|jgi:cation:H+ antiporter